MIGLIPIGMAIGGLLGGMTGNGRQGVGRGMALGGTAGFLGSAATLEPAAAGAGGASSNLGAGAGASSNLGAGYGAGTGYGIETGASSNLGAGSLLGSGSTTGGSSSLSKILGSPVTKTALLALSRGLDASILGKQRQQAPAASGVNVGARPTMQIPNLYANRRPGFRSMLGRV